MDGLLQSTFVRHDHPPPSLPVSSRGSSSRLRHSPAQSIMAWGSIKRSFSSLKPDEKFGKNVDKIAGGLHPSDREFPWDRLSDYASGCIRKQKNIDIHNGIDEYLVSLIKTCSAKDAAVAACANILSQHVVEALLNEFKPELCSIQGLQGYIQILLAVNHYQLQVVDDAEAKRARTILHLLNTLSNDPIRLTEPLALLIDRGVPRSSHLSEFLDALARQSCLILSTRMETFKANADWYSAHKEAPWLEGFLSRQEPCDQKNVSIIDILNKNFPTWQKWAVWKPDPRIIDTYHMHFNHHQRDRVLIRDLLALEGPDFSIGTAHYPTMKEQLCWINGEQLKMSYGKIHFDFLGTRKNMNHVRNTLGELSKLLVRVCIKDSPSDNSRMMLLQEVCLTAAITEVRLSLLEAAFDTASSSVIAAVTEIEVAGREGREPDPTKLVAIFQALEWEGSTELRKLLGDSVVASMCKHLENMQDMLKMIVNVGRSWYLPDLNHLEVLQSFGEICGKAPKLKNHFPAKSQTLLQIWPAKWEVQECYQIILLAQANAYGDTKWLTTQVEEHLLHRLVEPASGETPNTELVEHLIALWRKTQDTDRRSLALVAALPDSSPDFYLRMKCIQQLHFLDDGFLRILKFLVESDNTNSGEASVSFARALTMEQDLVESWRFPLRRMIEVEGERLEKWALQTLNVESWLSWIDDVGRIFPDIIRPDEADTPIFLRAGVHSWAMTLRRNLATLNRVEARQGMRHSYAMKCLLRGGDTTLNHELERILGFLNVACEEAKWDTFVALVARLKQNGSNAEAVRKAIFKVSIATMPGVEACLHVLESYEEVSLQVAETMLACWLNEEDMMTQDRLALEAVAAVLGLEAEEVGDPTLESIEATNIHLDEQFQVLIAEAIRLEGLRMAFKAKDPDGIALILNEVGVEDSFPLDDILADLPPELIDVVERISEHEVEFQLPLTKLTALQKKALGSGGAQSLLVRFSPGNNGLPPNFCLHWDDEPKELASNIGHSPCVAFPGKEPDEHSCHGRPTPGVFQFSRILSKYLSDNGFSSLQDIYNYLVSEMANFHTKCIVCGVPHPYHLVTHGYNPRRPTTCADSKCSRTYKKSHLDIRIADIRHDPAVVDLLLAMTYASASSANLSLLPGCPITDMNKVRTTLNSLPRMDSLQHVDQLYFHLDTFGDGNSIRDIMSWCLNSYRGFLVSATANLKIPSFPGAHQFLLANASPQLEIDFDSKYKLHRTSRVVFHGTTIDRLYAILSQGLKDLSGTALQRHGQAYGKGVYVSTEPNTAWGYAQAGQQSWSASNFSNHKVMLACELTGSWSPASGNIHVITDPACLMVRYVFMMPNNASIPASQHVVPALSSVFANLRSGAL